MEPTQSEPATTTLTPRVGERRGGSGRVSRYSIRRLAGRATALSFGFLTSVLLAPEVVVAWEAVSSECERRLQGRAIEDVQQRLLDRWDDVELFEDDAAEWMRLHRDEWEWLLSQRLETYCPAEPAHQADRTTPVRLTLFVRGGRLSDVTGNLSPDHAALSRSTQFGVAGGVALRWEFSP